MHYRPLSIGITIVLFTLLWLSGAVKSPGLIFLTVALAPVLIVLLAIGVLKSPGTDTEPPARNKWYHF